MIQAFRQRQPQLSRECCCQLLALPRSSYYRPPRREPETPTWLRDRLEELVLEFPGYGYRRVTAQLQREGAPVNHKRVLRVMRQESLLCQLQRRWVRTTDSEHGLAVYPNLLKSERVAGLNQVWVADLTYLRLPGEFCYLAALLDAYSRKVVGWELARSLEAELALAALERALGERQPPRGWLHHSDRGVQYACRGYVERLQAAGARISMSAQGRPRDNAQAESFFRTLKQEEVYLSDYQSYAEAQAGLKHFIEEVYNRKRLHSSLGYRPPCEFEALGRAA